LPYLYLKDVVIIMQSWACWDRPLAQVSSLKAQCHKNTDPLGFRGSANQLVNHADKRSNY
jgi:hypothetical protein